jgi:hypothetical protein
LENSRNAFTYLGMMSARCAEHHVRNEIRLDGVENWELDALQTERPPVRPAENQINWSLWHIDLLF